MFENINTSHIAVPAILLSLVLLATPSYAEWLYIADNIESDVYYIETKTINSKNGYVYYDMLVNYEKPNNGAKSVISNHVGNCQTNEMKYNSDKYFSKQTGKGTFIGGSSIADVSWLTLPIGSAFSNVQRYACEKLN